MSRLHDIIKNWHHRPFINYWENSDVLRVVLPQPFGDAVRYIFAYYNVFRYIRLPKVEIYFHSEQYSRYWRPLLEDLNKAMGMEVVYFDHVQPDLLYCLNLPDLCLGCSFFPRLDADVPKTKIMVHRKTVETVDYVKPRGNLSHRIYPFEFWCDVIDQVKNQYGDNILQFYDNHAPQIPNVEATTGKEAVAYFQNCNFVFGEISYGHQLALACGTPFLTCQTYDPEWTLRFCSNLIFDLRSRNVIFGGTKVVNTLLQLYVEHRSLMLSSVERILKDQAETIKSFNEHSTGMIDSKYQDLLCEARPDLQEYFMESENCYSKLILRDGILDLDYMLGMSELDRGGHIYTIFRMIYHYLDLVKNFNYLAREFQYIRFNRWDLFGNENYGYVESQICHNDQECVYPFGYHIGQVNYSTPIIRYIDLINDHAHNSLPLEWIR